MGYMRCTVETEIAVIVSQKNVESFLFLFANCFLCAVVLHKGYFTLIIFRLQKKIPILSSNDSLVLK
jgi:hypothetical protein